MHPVDLLRFRVSGQSLHLLCCVGVFALLTYIRSKSVISLSRCRRLAECIFVTKACSKSGASCSRSSGIRICTLLTHASAGMTSGSKPITSPNIRSDAKSNSKGNCGSEGSVQFLLPRYDMERRVGDK